VVGNKVEMMLPVTGCKTTTLMRKYSCYLKI